MLELKNVSKFYYNKGIITSGFTKINLKLNMGEFVVITGESGSGKSTLLNVLSGLDTYEEGEMYINGKETSHYSERDFEEYRRKYIANIFQSFNLVNSYTVYQNIELVMLLNGYKKHNVKKKILKIIDEVGLTKFKNTKVSKLSGGQKQRVAIARAMVKDTPIIVADEPTGNLDSKSAEDVVEILHKVAKNKLVIIVTHNLEQFEEYATRIIKMHDGKIIENREIVKVNEEIKPTESKFNKITLFNKYRLGIRNTFNLFTKFTLLFMVFLFITMSILFEYSGLKLSEYNMNQEGFNAFFKDVSDNRIILKKKDKSFFTNEDYVQIKNMSNVDYIIENDFLIDSYTYLTNEENHINFSGGIKPIELLKEEIDEGRNVENDNEIIMKVSKEHYFIKGNIEKVLNNEFKIGNSSGEEGLKVKIVGLIYKEERDNNAVFYMSSNVINNLRKDLNQMNSKASMQLDGKIMSQDRLYFRIYPSTKIAKGKAVIDDNFKYETSNGRVINKDIVLEIENIYYKDSLKVKVSNTYGTRSIKRLTGYTDYERYRNVIFINDEEYQNLYDKPSYQASVYIKETDKIEEDINELINLGFIPKKASDFRVNNDQMYSKIMQVVRTTVTIILVFVLFFISYFIIRIILKSRNTYYTILRMLGANGKTVKRILDIELFINSSLAYLTSVGFIELVRNNIIKIEFISKLAKYISIKEYLLIYIILVLMTRLISNRFSRKVFKKSAINTYNEEV